MIVNVAFDYSVLANFYASGASLNRGLQADVLRNGVLKDALDRVEIGVTPPWRLRPEAVDDDSSRRFFTGGPIIDLDDPTVNQPGASDNFKKLFALYKGLSRISEMALFAQDNVGLRTVLDRQFQQFVKEIRAYTDESRFEEITLVSGLKQDTAISTVNVPAKTPVDGVFGFTIDKDFLGGIVAQSRSDAISGLSATDEFTIDVETASGTTSVTVNLGGAASLSIDDVVDHINDELVAAGGISTTFKVSLIGETDYAIEINVGRGEDITFTPVSATEAAVFISGTYGSGASSGGFVSKLDNLDLSGGADPNAVFTETINTDQGDSANGVAVDSKGNVYVVGATAGDLAGQGEIGDQDVYLNKYDGGGNLLYTVRLGATTNATGFAVAVDGNDDVVIVGNTFSPLTDIAYGGGYDTFVTKFDSTGKEIFTRQAAPFASDTGLAVTFDSSNNIFLSGVTSGEIATDQTHVGGKDAFVTKLDSDGVLVYNKQFGTTGEDLATGIAVDNAGNIYVSANVDGDAVVRKYADSASSTATYEINLGSLEGGEITGITVDSGKVYVTGYTTNAALTGPITSGQEHSGGIDAFVTQIDDTGESVDFTSYVGTADDDRAFGIAVNSGDIYITGSTEGSIDGETLNGVVDSFVAKLDSAGTLAHAHQLGGAFEYRGTSIAFDTDGTSVLTRLGLPHGTVPTPRGDSTSNNIATVAEETTARVGQSFFLTINNEAPKRITIEDTDTLAVFAARLSNMLGTYGDAKVINAGKLEHLEIQAINGAVIELTAGADGFDALLGLGLKPQRLIGEVTNPDQQDANDAAAFELGFTSDMNLLDQTDAGDAKVLVDNAMRVVRKAFEFLTEGPPPDNPFADLIGPPPPYLAARIAAFESALFRIQVISPFRTTSGGIFA